MDGVLKGKVALVTGSGTGGRGIAQALAEAGADVNTGEPFGTSARMVVAQQAIHHAPGRASHVVLPVIARDH